ncbi:uncharacterized protein LOC134225294 isoform X2 [Armigeres subalbatus]|uniref:uncharacterized protein LOC134225294 isoform X2 n=1 Tax=Armigeres subalbatus TaxID=124917 RepID=UPI002ED49F66
MNYSTSRNGSNTCMTVVPFKGGRYAGDYRPRRRIIPKRVWTLPVWARAVENPEQRKSVTADGKENCANKQSPSGNTLEDDLERLIAAEGDTRGKHLAIGERKKINDMIMATIRDSDGYVDSLLGKDIDALEKQCRPPPQKSYNANDFTQCKSVRESINKKITHSAPEKNKKYSKSVFVAPNGEYILYEDSEYGDYIPEIDERGAAANLLNTEGEKLQHLLETADNRIDEDMFSPDKCGDMSTSTENCELTDVSPETGEQSVVLPPHALSHSEVDRHKIFNPAQPPLASYPAGCSYGFNAYEENPHIDSTASSCDGMGSLETDNQKLRQAVSVAEEEARIAHERWAELTKQIEEAEEELQIKRASALAVMNKLAKQIRDRESILEKQMRLIERLEGMISEKDKELERLKKDCNEQTPPNMVPSEQVRSEIYQRVMELYAKNVKLAMVNDDVKSSAEQKDKLQAELDSCHSDLEEVATGGFAMDAQ